MIDGIAPDTLPMLHFRGLLEDRVRLAAVIVRRHGQTPPPLHTPDGAHEATPIGDGAGATLWRYTFELPVGRDAGYTFDGRRYAVTTDFSGDLSVAYTSCNGQEHGDLARPVASRNRMWRQLAERNARAPVHLLLQGGDQIYADEATHAHPLTRDWPDVPDRRLDPETRAELARSLHDAFFLRYATQAAQPGYADVAARIPSLCMWDDHDICDGWGSLPAKVLDSSIGRCLFSTARAAFLMFQMACTPDERPDIVTGDGHLSWHVALPGVSFVAPDLRSTRRPDRVMDDACWTDLETVFGKANSGHMFLLSSVPALGPRLSLIERAMQLTNRMEKYEDDLRDQWQSRAHRREWQRFLRLLLDRHGDPDTPVTVLSGEIHLATRATMDCSAGPLHQLVASGISHPAPPRLFARGLGTLARLGEAPLPEHPIRLRSLPGRPGIYCAQRNYLMLERSSGSWTAQWALEKTGLTPPLAL
ncbi:alkaline phosphatase family protein [Maribius pontilimi]|uniref:Alkaline phosphatase family protein n=1 Tax=Palleronia pontilimi TaxID=1964209 RepID=A0A934I764_9RHOB|nr:alkaline phosphatase D family protein [Palleronia pontilimi]MBJ3761483.1 alkaline phosphatase family protein [Palleronia pontilimi]